MDRAGLHQQRLLPGGKLHLHIDVHFARKFEPGVGDYFRPMGGGQWRLDDTQRCPRAGIVSWIWIVDAIHHPGGRRFCVGREHPEVYRQQSVDLDWYAGGVYLRRCRLRNLRATQYRLAHAGAGLASRQHGHILRHGGRLAHSDLPMAAQQREHPWRDQFSVTPQEMKTTGERKLFYRLTQPLMGGPFI